MKLVPRLGAPALALCTLCAAMPALADNCLIGEVKPFAGRFEIVGYAVAAGQILRVDDYPALSYVLGNRFGGDGKTTFALPDLRQSAARGVGTGRGLGEVKLGAQGGAGAIYPRATGAAAGTDVAVATTDPFPSLPPYLAVTYLICVDGEFPQLP